jgi:sugar phosphate isomerase/epimerase
LTIWRKAREVLGVTLTWRVARHYLGPLKTISHVQGNIHLALNLACADFSFPELEHGESLDLIRRLGFRGVDIGLFPKRSHFQPSDYAADVRRGAATLTRRLQNSGLEIADIFLQSGADLREHAENHPGKFERQKSRELFLRTLEFASHCDAKHITSLPGIHWEGESIEDSFKRSVNELAWRAELAQSAGIVYSVEPHLWSIVPTPEAAMRLVDAAPELTLTLDYGHFVCQGIANERIQPLAAYASHYHARSACPGFLQSTLTHNTIDFRSMIDSITRIEYPGWIGVEYVCMPGVAVISEVDNVLETTRLRSLLTKHWTEGSRKRSSATVC